MASTTIDTDTELSAVNSILGAIGQSPITALVFDNPEVSFVYNLLRDANVDIQSEGWHFNTEKHVAFQPDNTTGKISIGNDILQMDLTEGWVKRKYDVVRRNGFLYDKYDHTDVWTIGTDVLLDLTRLFSFEEVPPVFRRYIIARASRQAATQLVANRELSQLLSQQEALARAAVMEYECNQGNHTMFGLPEDSVFRGYQPWRALAR